MKRLGLKAVCLVVFALVCVAPAFGNPSLEWDLLYDGSAQYRDVGTAALTDDAGNLVVGGSRADLVDGTDIIVRLLERETGTTLWTATWAINTVTIRAMMRWFMVSLLTEARRSRA